MARAARWGVEHLGRAGLCSDRRAPDDGRKGAADPQLLLDLRQPDAAVVQDKGGDENFLLYGVNVATGEERLLTPFENTRVGVVAVSNRIHDRILVGLNNRDPRWHDVHSLDLATGKLPRCFAPTAMPGSSPTRT